MFVLAYRGGKFAVDRTKYDIKQKLNIIRDGFIGTLGISSYKWKYIQRQKYGGQTIKTLHCEP